MVEYFYLQLHYHKLWFDSNQSVFTGIPCLENLPMELLQTFIFPYLGYDDLCNLKETKNSRLNEIVDDFISPGKTNKTQFSII